MNRPAVVQPLVCERWIAKGEDERRLLLAGLLQPNPAPLLGRRPLPSCGQPHAAPIQASYMHCVSIVCHIIPTFAASTASFFVMFWR